ncbi:hypothetical protein [Streptomyces sp. NPDC050504]|uniref:hypothetical protein n=1 Tax=Streptomyces sp. NPDC050504 TaxID=3365618 RepID=UPI003798CCA2
MLPQLSTDLLLDPRLIVAVALIAVIGDALLPVLPSGTLVLAAAVWAAPSWAAVLVFGSAVALASMLGDVVVLRLARRLHRRHPGLEAAALRLRGALADRLGRTTVAARFVPGGRLLVGLAVSASTASQRRYLCWSALAGAVWSGYLLAIATLGSLWFDSGWLGLAVSTAATVTIGTCLARALRNREDPATGAVGGGREPVLESTQEPVLESVRSAREPVRESARGELRARTAPQVRPGPRAADLRGPWVRSGPPSPQGRDPRPRDARRPVERRPRARRPARRRPRRAGVRTARGAAPAREPPARTASALPDPATGRLSGAGRTPGSSRPASL